MTPEATRYIEKALQCLANARASLDFGLSNDAGRGVYLAAFHASQAFIFERTGKAAKTHQGVQSEFHRLALNEPRIDKAFPPFLTQAYNLKAVADYETGPNSDIPPERSAAAIETAARFLDCITALLDDGA
ncbi:MAG: HEPN domain-containing protein [Methylococcales bacterium]